MLALACSLALLAGLILGLLGGGGSVLIVPILIYVAGLPVEQAITASLFAVAITSAIGAADYARRGRVQGRRAVMLGGAGMLGSLVGGLAAHRVPPALLLAGFTLLMAAAAVAMLRVRPARPRALHVSALLAIGLAIGALTGLVGAGGGFLVVPALVVLGGVEIRDAAGTSLVVIALQSTSGFAGHLAHVAIPWPSVLAVTITAGAGAALGARLGHHLSPATLRKGFAGLLLAIASTMLVAQLAGA